MKFLLVEILGNAAAFAVLYYPVYSWRGGSGVVELTAAAGAVTLVFALAFIALHKKLSTPTQYTGSLMLGKMGLHMGGMIILFFAIPKITGLDYAPVILWMVAFFFLNLDMEMVYLIKISKMLAGEAGKKC